MNFFIFSFLVGVSIVFIPSVNRYLLVFQKVFNLGSLGLWQMVIFWGLVSSVLFFVSKDLIEKNGPLKFWLIAVVLAIFLIVFTLFVKSSPNAVF